MTPVLCIGHWHGRLSDEPLRRPVSWYISGGTISGLLSITNVKVILGTVRPLPVPSRNSPFVSDHLPCCIVYPMDPPGPETAEEALDDF